MSILNPRQQKLLLADVDRLDIKTSELITKTLQDAEQSLPSGFLYSIQKRKVSDSYQYYWRLKAGTGKRNYLRINADQIQEYLSNFDVDFRLRMKGIEQDIMIANVNLKYITSIRTLISSYRQIAP